MHNVVNEIIERMENGGSLSEAFAKVFAILAAGPMWFALFSNGEPLVKLFNENLAMNSFDLSNDVPGNWNLRQQLDEIGKRLKCDDVPTSNIRDFIWFLLQNWNEIGKYSCSYWALAELARRSASWLNDTEETRNQFVDTLRDVSSSWTP